LDPRVNEMQDALSALRVAFRSTTSAVSRDPTAAGLVFAGHMLEESLVAFEQELVRFASRKGREDANQEGL
jgi:hypothetical protein